MTDPTLISELREAAEWARAELNQARAELFDRAAEALDKSGGTDDDKALIAEARLLATHKLPEDDNDPRDVLLRRLADALERATGDVNDHTIHPSN